MTGPALTCFLLVVVHASARHVSLTEDDLSTLTKSFTGRLRHSNKRASSARQARAQIIPQPVSVQHLEGPPLMLGPDVHVNVVTPDAALKDIVKQFLLDHTSSTLSETGSSSLTELRASDTGSAVVSSKVQIELSLEGGSSTQPDDESYCLEVSEQAARVSAKTNHGLFNGAMTLSQLPRPAGKAWELHPVKICDKPAMKWRGLMLDVSRHFFPAENVKKLLNTMALFKLNRFHWHLTDDQGWRVNIADYPNLVKKGAYRSGTQIGHDTETNDQQQYGGFYSDEDIRDVVAHAALLQIEVTPEVDLPGHVQAAVASYPQLGNTNSSSFVQPKTAETFGTHDYTLAPTEESFKFVSSVLTQVMNLVPSDYVHIGGDEVSTRQWGESARAQKIMAGLNKGGSLAETSSDDDGWSAERNERKVQALFTKKIAAHVVANKRTPIVWDEALDSGSLPNSSIIMVWRPGPDPRGTAKKAAAEGHRVILAPQWYTYFDHPQAEGEVGGQHDSFGGDTLSLRKVYEMPISEFGEVQPKGAIMGGQAQLWSEYIKSWPDLEYMAWPRGLALSEVLWRGDARPSFEDFRARLPERLQHLQRLGVGYRELKHGDLEDSDGTILSQLGEELGAKVIERRSKKHSGVPNADQPESADLTTATQWALDKGSQLLDNIGF